MDKKLLVTHWRCGEKYPFDEPCPKCPKDPHEVQMQQKAGMG